jgi:hypothetical protein
MYYRSEIAKRVRAKHSALLQQLYDPYYYRGVVISIVIALTLKHPSFRNTDATVNFCRTIDKLFDLLLYLGNRYAKFTQ